MNNAGKLDRRVTIQQRTLTKDNTGTRVETWEDIAEVWAEYVTHRGTVAPVADAERGQDSQQWRIRWRTLTPATNYRIIYGGSTYDIESVTQEGRKNTLLLDTIAIQSIS